MCKIRPARISVWLLLGVIGFPVAAHCAEVLDSSVTQQDERYLLHVEAVVQVPVAKVRELIKNYKNFPRLSPDIKQHWGQKQHLGQVLQNHIKAVFSGGGTVSVV